MRPLELLKPRYEYQLPDLSREDWEQAEAVISRIVNRREQAEALRELRLALAQARQWERAEAVSNQRR